MSSLDFLKKLEEPRTFYLYNNEYETFPSLLGDNVEDLISQASDLGMYYLCARYVDVEGKIVCHHYHLEKTKKDHLVIPVLLK